MDPQPLPPDAEASPPPRVRRERRGRRSARQRGRWLAIAAAALAVVAAVGWGLPWLQAWRAAGVSDAERNRAMASRVIKAHQMLQFHAQRAWRKPGEPLAPASGEFVAFLQGLDHGDGQRLLANPYGAPPQARSIPVAEARGALPPAADRAAGKRPAEPLRPMGPGRQPADGPYTAFTYGALVYDFDPRSDRYVLYGIGRVGDQAAVVHQVIGP